MTPASPSRRDLLRGAASATAALSLGLRSAPAQQTPAKTAETPPEGYVKAPWNMAEGRPKPADRRFRSEAVERFLTERSQKIADPQLKQLFLNCFPNTLDTTVEPGTFEGKPDTVVVTGDIQAMWLRDSSAQVWPYLPLAKEDKRLRELLAGVINRQARCILIDPYANAFMADLSKPAMEWSQKDQTDLKQGDAERKWEVDSLCYPIRLAHGYWTQTGDTSPFDARWRSAMSLIVNTFRTQQRKQGLGPYRFLRTSSTSTETLPNGGYGNPVQPVGLIASGFRPSDDACIFPFLVPSNLFAVVAMRQLAEMANAVLRDTTLAKEALSLADEVEKALQTHAVVSTPAGTVWAYEVDGYGGQNLMDDANVPSILGLPYLGAVGPTAAEQALYTRSRQRVWSEQNPWFFKGLAGEGIGGPHVGRDAVWPMSQIVYALTAARPGVDKSLSDSEIRHVLQMMKVNTAGFGFVHESFNKDNAREYTRAWFAWANTLFGELLGGLAASRPELLQG